MEGADNPDRVRYRVVVELTFADADPRDPSDHDKFLAEMTLALANAPNVNCKQVMIREAELIGSGDDRGGGGREEDFSGLSPDVGHLFGVSCPVAVVDPGELAKVREVMAKADAGELRRVNIAVAVGQVLQSDSDAQAVIARAFILRALQKGGALPGTITKAMFEKAARFPIERRPENGLDLQSLARFFGD